MQKNIIPLRNIQAPAASATCVIDIPVAAPGKGRRYHSITIEHGFAAGTNTAAGAATNVSEIRLVANGGTVIRKLSGTELRDLNLLSGTGFDFQGVPNTAPGCAMTINFAEPWRQQPDRDALALATAWKNGALSGLQLQVDLGAASTPTIAATAEYDEALPDTQPGFLKIIRQDITASGTSFDTKIDALGILNMFSLYADSGGSLQSSKVTVRMGDRIAREVTKSANFAQLSKNGMFPTASGRTTKITDIVFDHDDFLRSGEDLRGGPAPIITIEAASAMSGTIRAILQRLEAI